MRPNGVQTVQMTPFDMSLLLKELLLGVYYCLRLYWELYKLVPFGVVFWINLHYSIFSKIQSYHFNS